VPITVVCRSCHQRFQVSDKFAGKSGPCPKCKATIYIPKPEEEVKIHTPEHSEASAKGVTGQLLLKPIAREKTKLAVWQIVALAVGLVAVLIAALALRWFSEDVRKIAAAIGLLVLSAPLAAAAYTFLRDPELEPHSGLALWTRAAICGAIYIGCWAFFVWGMPYFVPWAMVQDRGDIWKWVFVGPMFGLAGATAALATFDLDLGNGFFHFCFYVVVTLLLALTMGLQLW
jgi:hypothetical protein